MRKDIASSSLPPTCPHPSSPIPRATRLQFFVRLLSQHTLVLQANSSDTIESVHKKVESLTGIPAREQGLMYRGKHLYWEQTLAECKVQNDAGIHMVGRLRSTDHPRAWQIVDEVVSLILYLYKNNPSRRPPHSNVVHTNALRWTLVQFLTMASQKNGEKAGGYLKVFSASSAPVALVMLYMSSHSSNKEAAEDAIKSFVTCGKTLLPEHVHHRFVPIVLEFCRLLSKVAGAHDPLYALCRSSLGAMLGCVDMWGKKGLIGIQDIFPFVSELATKFSIDLKLYLESSSILGPTIGEINDFSALLAFVKNEIKGDVEYRGPMEICEELYNLPMCNAIEIASLHGIFVDLLSKLEKCLVKIEEHEHLVMKNTYVPLPIGSSHYIAIAKELHGISKLYRGCNEMFWETMKQRKDALCYLIINYAKRKENNLWIIECKEVTTFEARKHLALMMLPEVKDEWDELHEMLIDRSHMLEESFEYIAHADATSLHSGLFMEFKNEEATGPGVLREWFVMVCQAIFNPQNALFVACPNDRRRFFPNPASKVDPLHLEYFIFSGRVIALALMHEVQVGIVFDRVFFKQLAGHPITLEDVRDADPYLYCSCKQILEMNPDDVDQDVLGLTFIDETEELGKRKMFELCRNGENVAVNSANRRQYVDELIRHRFVTAIWEQVDHFVQGFTDIMSCRHLERSLFQLLDLEDLDRMLHGSESEICVNDWKAHTEYHGFEETDAQITWFWEVVTQMKEEQKRTLLFFWTSIKFLPVEGFGGLASQLQIFKTSEPSTHLPTSHTCFYRLCFPSYPSLAVTKARVDIITREHIGCSFGTW